MPSKLVRSFGLELAMPGFMSLTPVVPPVVPSDFQSSTPKRGVEGAEVKGAADLGEAGRGRAGGTRNDVPDQGGAARGAVGLPELDAVGAVVGGEVEGAVEVGEACRARAAAAGVYVLDQGGAARGAVGLPELDAVGGIGGA